MSECYDTSSVPLFPGSLSDVRGHAPGVGLVAVSNHTESQGTEESVDENVLPALVLVLLAGLDAEEPASGWVVVFFVRTLGAAQSL